MIPPWGRLRATVAAIYLLTASGYWFTASGSPARENSDGEGNEVSALKTEMQKMQKEYQDRIAAMEAEMKALESKSDSGSILNTRVLSDADEKGVEGPSQVLDESFLKSLTRNFTFSAYVRAGFQFNGNGAGGNFSFSLPSFLGAAAKYAGQAAGSNYGPESRQPATRSE